jgi:hypothetical protein
LPSSGWTKVAPLSKQIEQLQFVMRSPVYGFGEVRLRQTEG